MSRVITDVFGNDLKYRLCTLEDVDKHFRCVRRIVETKDREAYKQEMIKCVEESTAYCMEDSNVFFYYSKESEHVAKGISFSWVGRPVEWLALLTALLFIEDTKTIFIRFYLHNNTVLQDFKTVIRQGSLKGQLDYPKRAMIRADELRTHLEELGVFQWEA